jgi:hypothetical protein
LAIEEAPRDKAPYTAAPITEYRFGLKINKSIPTFSIVDENDRLLDGKELLSRCSCSCL